MLIIRREQIITFEELRLKDFENRLLEYLEEEISRGSIPPVISDLPTQVTRGINIARGYGFRSEKHVAGFIEATCRYLGGFSDGRLPKPALAILHTYGIEPELKLRRYYDWVAAARDFEESEYGV